MSEPLLPVEAARGDLRHRDVRAQVLAVIPQRQAAPGKRIFWWLVLLLARVPGIAALLRRARQGS